MNLCVIGTGYVGLVTGAVFSDLGYTVYCADTDGSKIDMLNCGKMPIYEPGLEEVVERNTQDGRLFFSTDIGDCISRSEIVFIAVGTPPGADGYADLGAVKAVAKTVAQNLNSYKVVVNKSTVPVGTADIVREIIIENRVDPQVDFDVVSNPEFLREGNAITDTLKPDRIVIGASCQSAAMKLVELYAPLERPMVVTDVRSAEVIKYASNSFLATKISFINAIANICELAGADVHKVAKGIGLDARIGTAFLNAGLGWGGSCFGKDTACFIATAEKLGYDFALLKSVVDINSQQPAFFVKKINSVLRGLEGKKIAVLGLAFKPNTDDLRDGKSIEIMAQLSALGAEIRAYDPIAMDNARKAYPDVDYCVDPYQAAANADAIVIVTEWNEFKFLDFDRLKKTMRAPVIFDGRNMFDPDRIRSKGFEYHCVGRAAKDRE
ncbi:MAG: UDP-glucose/GDP-mannose dehydrogenase family protein [Armatimonadetes bacterium]|nr:UDP-glucose/GDP-mannose dehydrogenase family protein [Armatimonadota bacterium]